MRSWSVRHARWLKHLYAGLEAVLRFSSPVLRAIGYERLDRPFLGIEKVTKGFMLDSQNCGQCIVGWTGLSCPMNCPKKMRNGPCGGVRQNGKCEVEPDMDCVWVLAWEGNKRFREREYPIQVVQPPVDHRLIGTSAWLREVRKKTGYTGPEIVAPNEV
ncbi:MAG: methylenetetrahydrofolate reductase C-terminal domain-containing protein [Woeseiaceae bacterium]|nr:methylenetetrahydrofolate reductase C-terminal domain-containing protein [Woeseiaceae bacterium]